jgi:hypothetical protein
MKKIVAFVAIALILPMTSQAAVNSVKVSGDISSTAVSRDFSMGVADNTDTEDFILSQTRFKIEAQLTEGVTGVIRALNERVWGAEDNGNNANSGGEDSSFNIDLSYVQIEEFLSPENTLIVGRQNLRYGNGLIIGDPDTNQQAIANADAATFGDLSLRKSFDAFRMIMDYSPYTIDLVYAKVEEDATNVEGDVTVYGVNANYAWNNNKGSSDAYFFVSDNRRGDVAQHDDGNTYVVGMLNRMMPNDNLSLSLETAYQFGDSAGGANDDSLSAWALQFISNYRFLDEKNSQLGLAYTYLSGDTTANGGSAWDPMFEDQTSSEIINILFTNSNNHLLTISGSMMPRKDITVGASFTKAMLAEQLEDLSTFTVARGPAAGNSYAVDSGETDLGHEVNVYAKYDYTEDVQFKVTGAMMEPGNWFTDENNENIYSVRGGMTVSF